MAMRCFFASFCMRAVVGPSGTRSVSRYHFVSCSAQK